MMNATRDTGDDTMSRFTNTRTVAGRTVEITDDESTTAADAEMMADDVAGELADLVADPDMDLSIHDAVYEMNKDFRNAGHKARVWVRT